MSLIDNRADTLLWSREFVQPRGNEADLRQQIAYSTGQVLRCATEALAPMHRKLELPTLKLYLNGCADLSDLLARDPRRPVKVSPRSCSVIAAPHPTPTDHRKWRKRWRARNDSNVRPSDS